MISALQLRSTGFPNSCSVPSGVLTARGRCLHAEAEQRRRGPSPPSSHQDGKAAGSGAPATSKAQGKQKSSSSSVYSMGSGQY